MQDSLNVIIVPTASLKDKNKLLITSY